MGNVAERVRSLAPDGVDRIAEVAFDDNIALDEQVLRIGGVVAIHATGEANPRVP
jgi:NADPH2:quinone reductase